MNRAEMKKEIVGGGLTGYRWFISRKFMWGYGIKRGL